MVVNDFEQFEKDVAKNADGVAVEILKGRYLMSLIAAAMAGLVNSDDAIMLESLNLFVARCTELPEPPICAACATAEIASAPPTSKTNIPRLKAGGFVIIMPSGSFKWEDFAQYKSTVAMGCLCLECAKKSASDLLPIVAKHFGLSGPMTIMDKVPDAPPPGTTKH